MRKSPDGTRDVIEMQVPIEGSRSRTVRISGLGLPTKIGIGAVGLEDSAWLEMHNRDVPGHLRYDTVETIRGGMMPLPENPIQGNDQTYAARSGATFGNGTRQVPAEGQGEVTKVEPDSGPGSTMAWMVTDTRGKYLFVAPAGFDSFALAEAMAPSMHGEFIVEMLTAGTLTATDEIAAPGWRTLIEAPVPSSNANARFN